MRVEWEWGHGKEKRGDWRTVAGEGTKRRRRKRGTRKGLERGGMKSALSFTPLVSLSPSLTLSLSLPLTLSSTSSLLLPCFITFTLSLSLSLSPTLDPTVPPLLLPPPHTLRRRPAAPLLTRRGRHTVRTHSTGAAPTVCGRSAASLSKVWRAGGPNSPEPESQGAPSRSSSVADGSSPHVSVSHCLPPLFMPLLPLIQQAQ